MIRRAALVLTAWVCVGCPSKPFTQAWFGEDGARERLAKRASFDLSCSEQQLQFTPLGSESAEYKTVGVTGCSQKATYVHTAHGWLMNNEAQAKAQ